MFLSGQNKNKKGKVGIDHKYNGKYNKKYSEQIMI